MRIGSYGVGTRQRGRNCSPARAHGTVVSVAFSPDGSRVVSTGGPDRTAEVWDAPAAGVRPRNIYFEVVPLSLVRGVVVEDSVLGATEAVTVARERALPDELAGG